MKNNYFDCFLFTNNRGCDLIKKKTGIIKPEGEIVKERLFITPEYTTAKEIKRIRKELHLTQKEFAEFINCSKPTVERWERSEDVIRGPIVPFLKMLQKYPEYEQEVKVPAGSHCETFVALRTEVQNWRWAGVPFYLRTGKRMARKCSEIVIQDRKSVV